MVGLTLVVAQVDSPEELQQSATSAWETLVDALPRVGIALGALVVFVGLGRLLRPLVRSRLARRRTPSFARVFAKVTSSAMTIAGLLLAVTIVFPSVRPVDVLTGAGVLTIAVGFAFQDILQNLLAGVLLLFREPFKGGDQIEVGEVVGTVEEINIRETVVTTFDGRRVLIPNAMVYTDVIRVQTAKRHIRASFVVGIAYEADMEEARRVAVEAMRSVDGVAAQPPPEVLYTEIGDSTLDLEVLFWCDAHELEMRRTVARGIEAVKRRFDQHGIEIPCPIVALQATSSFQAALGGRPVTPGGAVGSDGDAAPPSVERGRRGD